MVLSLMHDSLCIPPRRARTSVIILFLPMRPKLSLIAH